MRFANSIFLRRTQNKISRWIAKRVCSLKKRPSRYKRKPSRNKRRWRRNLAASNIWERKTSSSVPGISMCLSWWLILSILSTCQNLIWQILCSSSSYWWLLSSIISTKLMIFKFTKNASTIATFPISTRSVIKTKMHFGIPLHNASKNAEIKSTSIERKTLLKKLILHKFTLTRIKFTSIFNPQIIWIFSTNLIISYNN